MKTIPVDVSHLEQAFDVNLHEFEPGEYPMSQLWNLLIAKLKPRGDVK